jgi:hypothetical protein
VTSLSVIDGVEITQVTQTLSKITQFQKLVQSQLSQNIDYGIIPGTGDKPTLLKPGAEKILMLMGLTTEFEMLDCTRDFQGGFFQYQVKARLYKNGVLITEGIGSCNTKEKKYVKQDPYSVDNTVLKMAKKRALIDATLLVASLSQIFTQDIEDMDLKGDKPASGQMAHDSTDVISSAQAKRIYAISGANASICTEVLKKFGYSKSDQVKKIDYDAICAEVEAAANGA